MRTKSILLATTAAVGAVLAASAANATLSTYQTFTGNVGISSNAVGSNSNPTSNAAPLLEWVPAGSTILSATLYGDTFNAGNGLPPAITINGTAISTWTALPLADFFLGAYRADVTSLIQGIIGTGAGTLNAGPANSGPGGNTTSSPFTLNVGLNSSSYNDGVSLDIVYSNPTLPTATVGLVDGGAASTGDSTSINFSQPLHPAAPGFFAEMRIGDGFSFDGGACSGTGQTSVITVNGGNLTHVAGCNDDGLGGSANGQLITQGANDDPFSPVGDTVTSTDHERYDLSSFINDGDTSISIDTFNQSQDDDIYSAIFYVAGVAGVNAPPPGPTGSPEPASLTLVGAGLAALGALRRRKK